MTLREMLSDIHALEEELAFERKYGVRSETFYAAYLSGEEPSRVAPTNTSIDVFGLDYSCGRRSTTETSGDLAVEFESL